MPPETFQTTLGEVARGVGRLEETQSAILARLDTQPRDFVTRREWEMHQASWIAHRQRVDAEASARRVPWTAVASFAVAALALGINLGVFG